MRRVVTLILSTAAPAAVTIGLAGPASAAADPVRPGAKVDLATYTGQWYQLAAIPALRSTVRQERHRGTPRTPTAPSRTPARSGSA